jgi:hypothetical protein
VTTAIIKKWADFQHYKNRCPPWIKLQKSILDDFDFACLPLASKALAPLLWLIASESMDGSVRIDPDWLAFRLRFTVSDIEDGLTPLIDKGFLILASGVLAPRLQHACLEGEAEAETEGEGETECATPVPPAPAIGIPMNDGSDFPITPDQVTEFSTLYPAVDVMQALRSMRAWSVANPTKRKTKTGVLRFVNAWLAKEQDSPKQAVRGRASNENLRGVSA